MSVFLEVNHLTVYRYANPVEFGVHKVMFRPRAAHDIHIVRASLEVSPFARTHWVHDVFSNSVAVVEPLEPATELRFDARFIVEHYGVRNLELPIAPEAENFPFEYNADDKLALSPYLPLQYPDDAGVVGEWVKQFLPARGITGTRALLRNIAEGVRNDLQYSAREATGTQRPAETLSLRGGTCRDYALLMIEAVRGLGLAARFVSGYLYDKALDSAPPAELSSGLQQGVRQAESLDAGTDVLGAGATHAWLHVYLPGAGWVPFDPTNMLFGGTDLIRVAYTRTPEQAAPVSGSWFGDASDYLGMTVQVSVRQVDAATAGDSTDDPSGEP
ncbi:MAG: transglutaminase family protein [Chromatiaceae bacterium]|jgi:transglutaminase-like putative cysteine protease|nr:transglutaminase family protein [Chromatiaceae bacterium]